MSTLEKLAYTIAQAAEACGVGVTVIDEACRRGDLVKSYPNSRPLILAAELQRWLESLPHEPVRR
jgi:hypothetical protein